MRATVKAQNRWEFTCWRDGARLYRAEPRDRLLPLLRTAPVAWRAVIHNRVPTVGLEHVCRRIIGGGGAPAFPGPGSVSGRAYPDGRSTPRPWAALTPVAVGDVVQPTFPNQHMYVCLIAGTTAASGFEPSWPTTRGATIVDDGDSNPTPPTWMEFSQLYLGLKHASVSPPPDGTAAGDTMASHSGWTEATGYSEANRPAFVNGAITSGTTSNTGSPALYPIDLADTLGGGFVCDFPAKGGAIGLLYGVGDFTSGAKVVSPGNLIGVTLVTAFATA